MVTEQQEKKIHKITCRITDTIYKIINRYEGESISDKLSNLIGDAFIQDDINKLRLGRQTLIQEIERLKASKDLLDVVFKDIDRINSENSRYINKLGEGEL